MICYKDLTVVSPTETSPFPGGTTTNKHAENTLHAGTVFTLL